MKKRRNLLMIVAVVLVVLLLGVSIKLISDTFTPPVTGLPPTSISNSGNSLQARYTQLAQTAQAKAAAPRATTAP